MPLLPVDLVQDFIDICKTVLSCDPITCGGLPSEAKRGTLKGYRAIAIDYNGIAYRLIYRVRDKPAPRRVEVIAFGEHDPAYAKAQNRVK